MIGSRNREARALASAPPNRPNTRIGGLPSIAPSPPTQDAAPAAVFGSSSALGTTGSFAGFTAAAASVARESGDGAAPATGGDDDAPADEEECQAEFKPVVQLAEVETVSGEEGEEAWIDL